MTKTTETFANLDTFETLSQQELMDVNGGRGFVCSWFGLCPQYKTESNVQSGLLS